MDKEPKFATGNDLLAILLEEYIRFYIPKGSSERISDFDFVPFFNLQKKSSAFRQGLELLKNN